MGQGSFLSRKHTTWVELELEEEVEAAMVSEQLKARRGALVALRALVALQVARGVASGKVQRAALPAGALVALSLLLGGPRHTLLDTILGTTMSGNEHVGGYVAPGFEPVRRAFVRNVKAGFERGAQFVVYHNGVKVVDLYGGTMPPEEYNEETLQLCFSCSKVLAALVVAMAVDKGRLRYTDRVSDIWPDFAQAGKGDITVADVLRHESGLAYFPKMVKAPVHLAARDRLDELAEFMAAQPPLWLTAKGVKPGDRVYHGTTRGFLLNEIVRRTDPSGRTIGQVLREELAEPLGVVLSLGPSTPEERERTTDLEFDGLHHTVAKAVWADMTGSARPDDRVRAREFFTRGTPVQEWMRAISYKSVPYTHDNFYNHAEFHDLEVPSVNLMSNARSLARVADAMARNELLSPETYAAAHADPVSRYDHGICFDTAFNQGGWCHFDSEHWDKAAHGFVGWGGFGGSQVAWHAEKRVGLAYTMNGPQFSSIMGFRDPRCLALLRATMDCVDRAQASSANPTPPSDAPSSAAHLSPLSSGSTSTATASTTARL